MSEQDVSSPDPAGADSDGYAFEISGGHLALDFTNTISRRADPAQCRDRLTHYGRLVSWAVQAGLISAKDGECLRTEASDRPRAAVAALRRAIGVREAMFSIFVALARGERPPAEAIDLLNAALPDALTRLRVAHEGGEFTWRFHHEPADLAPMLAPVVRAAAELLTSPERTRVRECRSETCFWLFMDRSKSGTRCWCDMKVCGNREKARRHYRRERTASRPGTRSAR
jgi:predicted RNA-binding Zn ribbon-like protein